MTYFMWTQFWPITELQRIDRKTRKIMVENTAKHPLGSTELFYLPRNKGGQGIKSLCPVYTAQTNPGSTRLCSHGQIQKTRVNTNLGQTRVCFSHAGQLVAFPGEVIVFCNQVYCFVRFALTFASNTPQSLMGERANEHVQNPN